jgi:competence protein ComEC
MFSWTPYIFVRLVFFLILGIVCQLTFPFFHFSLYLAFGLGALLYGGLLFLPKLTQLKIRTLQGLLIGILTFLFAYIYTFHFNQKNLTSHILHQNEVEAYTAVVSAETEEKAKSFKTEVEVRKYKIKGKWQNGRGRILLYVRKEANFSQKLQYGDVLLISGQPQTADSPRNPQEFDYRQYLAYQNIFHQHYIRPIQLQIIDNQPPNWFYKYSLALRAYFTQTFKKLIPYEREYAIGVALILGVKEKMDDEVSQAYANTGLLHVLAVSGMHVVFIVFLLQKVFGWTQKVKYGNLIYCTLIISLLWIYAFITGLSASVLRAVVMFSFVALAQAFHKRSLIYNNLALSAFLLLLYNPFFITSVGFQLSYLAVWGIVYFNPIFSRWYEPNSWLLDQIWQIITVSLAAQLATFPLGLYYFHQFPNYFLLANLLIIPLSTVVLYAGVAVLLVSWIPYLNWLVAQVFIGGIWVMNQITFIIEDLPFALSNGLNISGLETILIYFFLIFFSLFFQLRRFSYLLWASSAFFLIIGMQTAQIIRQNQQEKLILYHLNKVRTFGLVKGREMLILSDSALWQNQGLFAYSLKPSMIAMGIRKTQYLDIRQPEKSNTHPFYQDLGKIGILQWNKYNYLIIKELLKYNELKIIQNLKFEGIIIQKNALRDVAQLQKTLPIKQLLLDASNGLWYSRKLNQEAQKLKIPCYAVQIAGAWVSR